MFGIMAVLLGSGDAFHLVPRAVALCTTGLENFTVQMGLGKWITSITMTILKSSPPQNLQQIANGKSAAATPSELVQIAMGEIEKEPLLKTEYVEIVNSLNLQIVNKWDDAQDIQMCTAVYAGNVRLIDNIKLK